MNIPFTAPRDDGNPDFDAFARDLDAIVAGETPEPSELGRFAEAIQRGAGTVQRGNVSRHAYPLRSAERARIRDDVLAGGRGITRGTLPTRAARRRQRDRPAVRPGALRFVPDTQPTVTFLLVIAVLIAIGASFNSLAPGRMADLTPTALAQGQAGQVSTDATPEVVPTTVIDPLDAPFLAPVSPADCTVEPRPLDQVGEFTRDPGPQTARAYLPATDAADDVAVAAAESARGWEACSYEGAPGQRRAYESPRFIFEDPGNAYFGKTGDEVLAENLETYRAFSAQVLGDDVARYVVFAEDIFEGTPTPNGLQLTYFTFASLPSNAVRLADGRIALPRSIMYDSHSTPTSGEVMEAVEVTVTVLIQDATQDGRWVVDEQFPGCAGDCDAFWDQYETLIADAGLEPAPASPVATPAAGTDGCPVAPLTTDEIASARNAGIEVPERGYAPVVQSEPWIAEDVRAARDVLDLCSDAAQSNINLVYALTTNRFWRENPNGLTSAAQLERSKFVSEAFGESLVGERPGQAELNPVRLTYQTSGPAGTDGLVRETEAISLANPDLALYRTLADGRVAMYSGEFWLRREGSVPASQAVEGREVIEYSVYADFDDGTWRLDESLIICLGECDEYWAEWFAAAGSEATDATPRTDSALVDLPTADDCTVEPLTVDEVMAIVADANAADRGSPLQESIMGTPVDATGVTDQAAPVDPVWLGAITTEHRTWTACVIADSWFQVWALSSGGAIQSDVFARLYTPDTDAATARSILESLERDGAFAYLDTPSNHYGFAAGIPLVDPDPARSTTVEAGTIETATIRYDDAGNAQGEGSRFAYRWNESLDRWLWDSCLSACPELPFQTASVDTGAAVALGTPATDTGGCPVEPLTASEIAAARDAAFEIPERGYTPVVQTEPWIADDVRAARDLLDQCAAATETNANIAYALVTNRFWLEHPYGISAAEQRERSMFVSDAFGESLVGERPSQEELNPIRLVYQTSDTRGLDSEIVHQTDPNLTIYRSLADGRIATYSGEFWMRREGSAPAPMAVEGREVFTYTVYANFDDGTWRLDEALIICLGDCAGFWTDTAIWGDAAAAPTTLPDPIDPRCTDAALLNRPAQLPAEEPYAYAPTDEASEPQRSAVVSMIDMYIGCVANPVTDRRMDELAIISTDRFIAEIELGQTAQLTTYVGYQERQDVASATWARPLTPNDRIESLPRAGSSRRRTPASGCPSATPAPNSRNKLWWSTQGRLWGASSTTQLLRSFASLKMTRGGRSDESLP